MAKEPEDNLEGDDAPAQAEPVKAPSAWPPVIAMMIVMPAISYAMTQFVLIPSIRGAVFQEQAHAQAAKPAKAAKGEAKHGEGGKESAAPGGFSYDFENIVVNLSGAMGTRYLKTSFTVCSANAELKKVIEENKKQLLDVTLGVLGSRSLADLEIAGSRNIVRSDLIANLNQALKSDVVEQIYFTEFVVQ